MAKANKNYRANASQFFIAGELCRRGLVAVVTLGNCPHTDVLCSNVAGTKFVHIQVKTFVPGSKTCLLGVKAEIAYGENFFWVLGGIPHPGSSTSFEYFIIPSLVMAEKISTGHKWWLSQPGKKGRVHRDNNMRVAHLPPFCVGSGFDISCFKDAWNLIEDRLK